MAQSCLLRRALQEGDDADAVERKRIFVYCGPALAVAAGVSSLLGPSTGRAFAYTCGAALAAVGLMGAGVVTLVTRRLTLRAAELWLTFIALSVIVFDWGSASEVAGSRLWVCNILVMDILLAIGAGQWVQGLCLHSTAVWLLVSCVEDGFRLGIYGIDGWTDPDPSTVPNCSSPPCAIGGARALVRAFLYFGCMYTDFYCTRRFAVGQRKEKNRVEVMMDVAEQVCSSCVQFDLESAAKVLDESKADVLTPLLAASLRGLVDNLASYRSYLPQSCFENDADDGREQPSPDSDSSSGWGVLVGSTTCSVLSSCHRESPRAHRGTHSFEAWVRRSSHMSAGSFPASLPDRLGVETGADATARRFSDLGASVRPGRLRHTAQARHMTALFTNRRGLLDAIGRAACAPAELGAWLAVEVEHFGSAVQAQKGVVDLLSADHLQATFGAVRYLGAHRLAATRCAADLSKGSARDAGQTVPALDSLHFSSAVCTGCATCGDFGSLAAQRFMVIGSVSAIAPIMERIAAGWAASVLADHEVYQDVATHWDFRLCKVITFEKISVRPRPLWSMQGQRASTTATNPKEWMYELGEAPANPWEPYNNAVRQWSKGNVAEAQSEVTMTLEPMNHALTGGGGSVQGDGTQNSVHEALLALHHALCLPESDPPMCTVPSAAGCGAPAPITLLIDREEGNSPVLRPWEWTLPTAVDSAVPDAMLVSQLTPLCELAPPLG